MYRGRNRDHYRPQFARRPFDPRRALFASRPGISHGKVNIFNLAKNAGTSVDQIERFYARNLPLSPELARNLQIMGD
jgi:hypothetical protein